MSIDARAFRDASARFPTGVTVVTTRAADGGLVGVTANSFTSISLDPPLVSVSLGRSLRSFAHFLVASHFAINVLGEDQHVLSSLFARPGADKWAAVDPSFAPAGSPLIKPNIAAFECESYARYECGDHVIFVGRVLHLEAGEISDPLVFYRSGYRRLRSDETSALVMAGNS